MHGRLQGFYHSIRIWSISTKQATMRDETDA